MALATTAAMPNKNLIQRAGEKMEKSREEREEKALKKTEIGDAKITLERFGMARENIPTISELEQALEKADTETRNAVHRGFVAKMLEDTFEDYPKDFSIEDCRPLPKRGGIPKGFMALEREGRRGETNVYADTFERNGKKYANMRIDSGSHWDTRVNPCAVVVCELDKNGKPILEKSAIKILTEQELNHAATTRHKRPPNETVKVPGLKFRIIPAIWPGLYDVKKSKERLSRETRVAALGELVRGELTPEEYSRAVNAKAEAQERDARVSKRGYERETKRRLEELTEKREFAQIALRRRSTEANAAEQQVVDDTEAARKASEEKAQVNREKYGNFIRMWSNRSNLLSEEDMKRFAQNFEIDLEEARKIRGTVEEGLGLTDTRAVQELLKELENGDEKSNKELREFGLGHAKTLFEKSKTESINLADAIDKFYSMLNTIMLEEKPEGDEYQRLSRLYLLREQLIEDLKLEGKENAELNELATALENHAPVIEIIEENAAEGPVEVAEEDLEISRDRLNNLTYDLLSQLSNQEDVDYYGRMGAVIQEQIRQLISRGYSEELALRVVGSLHDDLLTNLREQADNPAATVLVERLEDPASIRTLTTPEGEPARIEPSYEADLNWLIGRIAERSTLENETPMNIYQGYRNYVGRLWSSHQSELARLGITSKNQLRKSISAAVKQIGA